MCLGQGFIYHPHSNPFVCTFPSDSLLESPDLARTGEEPPSSEPLPAYTPQLTLYHSYFRSLFGVADADLCLNPTIWVNWMEELCSFNGDIVTVPHKIGQRMFSECMFECEGVEKELAVP